MSIERREHVRQKVSRVEVKVASQESLRASYLRDLSMGGLFVRSKQPLPEGTAVIVELSVEEREPLRLRGEVTRQEHGPDGTARGFGVRFSTVDAETMASLELIMLEHQQIATPPPSTPAAALETQLAEARGTIEAYEETLALLRQSETDLSQRLEAAEAEREVLANVAHELQGQVQVMDAAGASLRAEVSQLMERLARGEAELKSQQQKTARLVAELEAARAAAQTAAEREETLGRLARELEAQTTKAVALQATFDAEVAALRSRLEERDDAKLREELQDVSARLDEERLKSMALERALQRFVNMGGQPK